MPVCVVARHVIGCCVKGAANDGVQSRVRQKSTAPVPEPTARCSPLTEKIALDRKGASTRNRRATSLGGDAGRVDHHPRAIAINNTTPPACAMRTLRPAPDVTFGSGPSSDTPTAAMSGKTGRGKTGKTGA